MKYLHKYKHWPEFTWEDKVVTNSLAEIRFRQGVYLGAVSSHGQSFSAEANLEVMSCSIVASSAIEGENLDSAEVKASVASRVKGQGTSSNRRVEGAVGMIWDATHLFDKPLTRERLFIWHACLFDGMEDELEVAQWRTGKMSVVSQGIGAGAKVHFEAPDPERLDTEMEKFLGWFESENCDPVLKSAVAHLWFLTIHPFADGNGRIARAISELCLARADQSARRFYSLSSQMEKERSDYYLNLESSQRGDLEISEWILWFFGCFDRAVQGAEVILAKSLLKNEYLKRLAVMSANSRQDKVIRRMLDDFQGNLTSSKYAKLAKCSQDTANRDINALIAAGLLKASVEGGRSRSYLLTDGSIE